LIRQSGESDEFLKGAMAPSAMWSSSVGMGYAPLVACHVDGLAHCGQVDPSFCLPDELREIFRDPDLLFPKGVTAVPKVVRFTGGSRREYSTLVRQQLKAGKVALMREPVCSAGTFVIAKRGTNRQREVWNRGAIIAASGDPPQPRLMADPAALTALEASVDRPLFVSSRDGACFFDQLELEKGLVPYFGRPQVRVRELCEPLQNDDADQGADMSVTDYFNIDDLRKFIIDDNGGELMGDARLSPVSLTWPMGFSHSSFVAQQLMSESCLVAGLDESQFLSSEGVLPDADEPSIAVATDDVNCFVRL
jgi:hypothetical protein